ncbi:MAG: hypothetical protein SYC29_12250 [Planctomycetota bacterium]|nr:hypothetical protein [Planctomycetota bacterium]
MNPFGTPLGGILLFALAIAAGVFVLIFVVIPLLKGIGWMIAAFFKALGWLIGNFFKLVGWLIMHVFEFVAGMLSDSLRFVGALIAMIVLTPMALLNVIIGRWSAAGHFAQSVQRECKVALLCVYRVLLQRPLKLVLLHGLLEGIEQRVPEAMAAAPTRDKPRRRAGQYAGYTIVGSLKGGGSGAKLYIARPDKAVQSRYPGMPDRVVIKSFALTEGSSLPQIVRESRALECAKQLGLVFDHGMDEHRFYYVMPFHAGDHLGIVTRQLHGETGGGGLGRRQLATVMSHTGDLLATLSHYHRGGLWHKDVKPENIIVHDGRAHLVDLGLITPLRSAMTLTTHGTEYFRDPEMVRQALRGVKVHQVNGVKFDIFAAGAVLYFMIENEFPPHGALSRFNKKSPDALRWIVRRGMADYSHRYESADEMLADLRHVAAAADPFAVKPADLPSMRGGAAEELVLDDEEDEAGVVEYPTPPRQTWPGQEAPGEQVASVSSARTPERPAPAPTPTPVQQPGRRPRLRVTNWWTGAYEVLDPGSASSAPPPPGGGGPHPGEQVRAVRRHATALRHQVADIRHRVRAGTVPPHRAAREQVRAARSRARDIRHRARTSRHDRAVAERQPSGMLFAIGGLTIVALVAALAAMVMLSSKRTTNRSFPSTTVIVPDVPAAGEESGYVRTAYLAVPFVRNPDDPRVEKGIDRVIADHRERGFNVVRNDALVEGGMRDLLAKWRARKDQTTDKALEDALEEHDLYGLLQIRETGELGRRGWDISGDVVYSTRPGAEDRLYALIEEAPSRSYLLINDHPLKHDPEVESDIRARIDRYGDRGWTLVTDTTMEAAVRRTMPPGPFQGEAKMPEVFHAVMGEFDLGGVLYIHAPHGREADPQRIVITKIKAAPIPPAPEAETPETPDLAEPSGAGAAGAAASRAA